MEESLHRHPSQSNQIVTVTPKRPKPAPEDNPALQIVAEQGEPDESTGIIDDTPADIVRMDQGDVGRVSDRGATPSPAGEFTVGRGKVDVPRTWIAFSAVARQCGATFILRDHPSPRIGQPQYGAIQNAQGQHFDPH